MLRVFVSQKGMVESGDEEPSSLSLRGVRHPLVELALAESSGGAYIASDVVLDATARCWLITGPNMGGKRGARCKRTNISLYRVASSRTKARND